MTPIRLLILAVLFYIGWRLLKRSFIQKRDEADRQGNDSGVQGVLVEDPVCHVLVPKHQALRLRKDGITYYFCSEQCCDQFAREPGKGEK
jgi:YHS domain-containing protein